jgi:hypothetical protein
VHKQLSFRLTGHEVTLFGHLSLHICVWHVDSGAHCVILNASVRLRDWFLCRYGARLRFASNELWLVGNILKPFFLTLISKEFQGLNVSAGPRVLHIRGLFEYAAARGRGTESLYFGGKAVARSFVLLKANSFGGVRSWPRVQILGLASLFDLIERCDTKSVRWSARLLLSKVDGLASDSLVG